MKSAATQHERSVRIGADRIVTDQSHLIAGRRIGILTNHTGRLSDGRPLVDAILESGLAQVVALFGPEHGISGNSPDGTAVDHRQHPRFGIPIYSLYGSTHKPTPEMLSDIEVLVCDIQDVGARFYTYSTTVALALEAAAEAGISFVLLDRPNPIRGMRVDGPVRNQSLKSFVAWFPLPITHGLTLGELLSMVEGEGWIDSKERHLEVVPLEGWTRSLWFDQTGLPWIPPSPNIPRLSTAMLYPGTCLLEGTTIAEGRGTDSPFELIGAPWADPSALIRALARQTIPGVSFAPQQFTPKNIPGVASEPKYLAQACQGVKILIEDRDLVEPVRLGIFLLSAFKAVHPGSTELKNRRFDILTGFSGVRTMLDAGADPKDIIASWEADNEKFARIRARYLMYD